jgi:hypothetical protein
VTHFEQKVWGWTAPVNRQYPRPWTSRCAAPHSARVFLVGLNQATEFRTSEMTQEEVVNALLGRGGSSLDDLYRRARRDDDGLPSPTRTNINAFVDRLRARAIHDVLETNVVCYSTSSSSELRRPEHLEGHTVGQRIFRELLQEVQPTVVVAHGAKTLRYLGRIAGEALPQGPETSAEGVKSTRALLWESPATTAPSKALVVSMRSLALPHWYTWHDWAPSHMDAVADVVATALHMGDGLARGGSNAGR